MKMIKNEIVWENNKLMEYRMEYCGIKNKCCTDENIVYSSNNEYVQCQVCKRLFKWKRIGKKISFFSYNKVPLMFLSAFIGSILIGVIFF